MTTKRVFEKTSNEEASSKQDAHEDKKLKLDETTTQNTKETSNDTVSQEKNQQQDESDDTKQKASNDNNPADKESTEERVNETIATARHEWLGQVERRHTRVGDDYQVTSLPVPGQENNEEPTNGHHGNQNGNK